ncbi:MAG: SRPBCC domain-containing protein [Dehalococcoidia bacterium]
MNEAGADVIEREIRIAARPEVVFSFFTDPAKMVLWKGMTAALDPRPGGIYRVNVTGRDIASGNYTEITPFTRIVFTWGWENSPIPPGSTTVEVDLTPDGDGTLLRLRHRGLTGVTVEEHAMGWDHYLPRLAEVAGGGDPGADPWIQVPPQDVTHAPQP